MSTWSSFLISARCLLTPQNLQTGHISQTKGGSLLPASNFMNACELHHKTGHARFMKHTSQTNHPRNRRTYQPSWLSMPPGGVVLGSEKHVTQKANCEHWLHAARSVPSASPSLHTKKKKKLAHAALLDACSRHRCAMCTTQWSGVLEKRATWQSCSKC